MPEHEWTEERGVLCGFSTCAICSATGTWGLGRHPWLCPLSPSFHTSPQLHRHSPRWHYSCLRCKDMVVLAVRSGLHSRLTSCWCTTIFSLRIFYEFTELGRDIGGVCGKAHWAHFVPNLPNDARFVPWASAHWEARLLQATLQGTVAKVSSNTSIWSRKFSLDTLIFSVRALAHRYFGIAAKLASLYWGREYMAFCGEKVMTSTVLCLICDFVTLKFVIPKFNCMLWVKATLLLQKCLNNLLVLRT